MSSRSIRVVAVVPAAGLSRRMGRDKLLLPWGDTVVVGAVAAALGAGGAGRIVVVTSSGNRPLCRWAESAEVELAINPAPQRGMLSSVWTGIEALGGADRLAAERTALLVCPGDHPALAGETVAAVVAALEAGAELAVPTLSGRRGHPLGVAPRRVAEIARLDPGIGLRQLLDRHPVEAVEVDDPGAVEDVDRPADYDRLIGEEPDGS